MKKQSSRAKRRFIFSVMTLVLALLVVLSLSVQLLTSIFPNPVQSAWQRVRSAGAYHFTADIVQTITPKASLANIGRTVDTQELHLDGKTDLINSSMEMQLWGQGGSIMLDDTSMDVKLEHGKTYVRQGDQAWKEQGDFTGSFAPEGDFLAYLAGMRDLTEAGTETRNGQTFTRYTFTVSGPDYAIYMKKELEQRLARNGELPPGITMDTPKYYRDMTGNGEIWLNRFGLPVRLELALDFPEEDEEQVSAQITTTFSNFASQPALWSLNGANLHHLAKTLAPFASNIIATCIVFAFTMMLIVYRTSRRLRSVLAISFSILLIVTPVLRNAKLTVFGQEQAALAAEMDTQGENSSMQQTAKQIAAAQQRAPHEEMAQTIASIQNSHLLGDDGTDDDQDGLTNYQEMLFGTDPHNADSNQDGTTDYQYYLKTAQSVDRVLETTRSDFMAEAQDPNADDDGDGLTNGQEAIFGTSYQVKDSDMDGLTDREELTTPIIFTPRGKMQQIRYLDPLVEDTNKDGLADGMECPNIRACPDTDGDGVPDVFDRDNDGDGVPDRLDLSPNVSTASNTFKVNSPLQFVANNLTPNKPAFVEWQMRPTKPDQLWYAYNVLDWPKGDQEGNIQDADGRTFYDIDQSLDANPNSYGDMKLIPMVEVTIHQAPYNLPDEETLKSFNISVRNDKSNNSSEKVLYLPVNLNTDPETGARVAFSARMPYLAGSSGWGKAHDVRLVWMVQMLNDKRAESKDNKYDRYEKYNEPEIVQVYKDESWYLTGMTIREDHGVEAAMLYENPAVDDNHKDDFALMALSSGLHDVFLAGRPDLTPQEIQRRFNHTTNGNVSEEQRWGIPNIMQAKHFSYPHIDAYVAAMVGTETHKVLDEQFTRYAQNDSQVIPTVMHVRTENYRTLNMDMLVRPGVNNVAFANHVLTADMTEQGGNGKEAIQKTQMNAFSWAPFRYRDGQWESCPKNDYWNELERRYPVDQLGEIDPTSDKETRYGQLTFAQLYYTAILQGLSNVVKVGEVGIKMDNTKVRDDSTYKLVSTVVSKTVYLALKGIGFIIKLVKSPATVLGTLIKDTIFWIFKALGKFILNVISQAVSKTMEVIGNALKGVSTVLRTIAQLAGAIGVASAIGVVVVVAIILVIAVMLAALALVIVAWVSGWISATLKYIKENTWAQVTLAVVIAVVAIFVSIIMPILSAIWTVVNIILAVIKGIALATALESAGLSLVIEYFISLGISVIVSAVIMWIVIGFAIYYLFKVEWGSAEFWGLITQTAAQYIVTFINVMIVAIPIIGVIIVGILGAIDMILGIFGKTTIREQFTQWIADGLHSVDVLVNIKDTPTDKERTGISLTDSDKGLRAGNTLTFKLGITTHLEPIAAKSPLGRKHNDKIDYHLPTRTNVKYGFSEEKGVLNLLPKGNNNGWVSRIAGQWQKSSPQLSESKELEAGINTRPFNDVKLYTSFALPGKECSGFFGILTNCREYTARFSTKDSAEKKEAQPVPIGSGIILDVFPATLDKFYELKWGGVGSSVFSDHQDFDGDGLHRMSDPNDLNWDTDSDGLSDMMETKLRSRPVGEGGAAFDLLKADTDGDGLSDLEEHLLGSNPASADTDNDGIPDLIEVRGWTFTYQGITTRVTSNPTLTDTDSDGISDAVEKRLHELSPTEYPYHPQVKNTPPVGMTASLSDDDGIMGPGQSATYEMTLKNALPGSYGVRGTLTQQMPAALGNQSHQHSFYLPTNHEKTIQSSFTVAAGTPSQEVKISNSIQTTIFQQTAAVQAATTNNTGINQTEETVVKIDGTPPTSQLSSLTQGQSVQDTQGLIIQGTANDANGVTQVEMSLDGGAWQVAEGAQTWTAALPTTQLGEGQHTIRTRATDLVGNVETPGAGTTFVVDLSPPVPTIETDFISLQLYEGYNTVRIRGSVADNASGTHMVEVLVMDEQGNSGNGWQAATVSGTSWELNYILASFDMTKEYTVAVRATDKLGNQTSDDQLVKDTLRVDSTIPQGSLIPNETNTSTQHRSTALRGIAVDPGKVSSGIKRVELAYQSYDQTTIFQKTTTIMRHTFDRLRVNSDSTTYFDQSSNGYTLSCVGEGCPTLVDGRNGKALSFQGDDWLSARQMDLANKSFTVALWAKRQNINQNDYIIGQGTGWMNHTLSIGFRSDNRFTCSFWGNDLTSPDRYTDTDWHHWACSYNAETRERVLYRDGQAIAHDYAWANYQGAGELTIGKVAWHANLFFKGLLDDVALYQEALTKEEVKTLAKLQDLAWVPATTSPLPAVAYHLNLPLDDAAGTTTPQDISGNNPTVQCTGGTCPEFGREGKVGTAAHFDGTDKIEVTTPFNMANQSFSVAFWAKRDGINQIDIAFTQGTRSTNQMLYIGFRDNNEFICDFWSNALITPAYTDTDWHHWICAYDAETRMRTIYRDGEQVAQAQAPAHYAGQGTTTIGDSPWGGWAFNGFLDNVQVLNYAVTALEAQALRDNSLPSGTERAFWNITPPNQLEGFYALYARVTDKANNRNDTSHNQLLWTGEVDTLAPRLAVHPYDSTKLYCSAEDLNINEDTFSCVGSKRIWFWWWSRVEQFTLPVAKRINQAPQWWNVASKQTSRLYRVESSVSTNSKYRDAQMTVSACDAYNNCNQVNTALAATSAALAQTESQPIETIIIEPTLDTTILTTTQQLTVTTIAQADATIKELTLMVNGEPYTTANYLSDMVYQPYSGTQVLWSTTWTPPSAGQYVLRTQAEDINGLVTTPEQTSGVTVTVDTTPPTISLPNHRITMDDMVDENGNSARIPLLVNDDVGVDQVQVWRGIGWMGSVSGTMTLDDGTTTPWSVLWSAADGSLPDSGTYTVSVRAIDVAGNTTVITEDIEADLTPPTEVDMTLSVDDGLGNGTRVITPGATIYTEQPTLKMEWNASSDGSGIASYRAGWTTSDTLDEATLAQLEQSNANSPRQRELAQTSEAQIYYAHLVIEDGFGNTQHQYRGPVYVDSPKTPDLIVAEPTAAQEAMLSAIPPHLMATKPATATADLAIVPGYTGWLDNGCSLVGTDRSLVRNAKAMQTLTGTQQLNMTWDDQAVRFAWSGADFSRDGDLFIYLDTSEGGAVRAYNPYETMVITPTTAAVQPQTGQHMLYLPIVQRNTASSAATTQATQATGVAPQALATQRGGKPFTLKPTGDGTSLAKVAAPWDTLLDDPALAATAVMTDGKLPQVGLPFGADYLIWITDTTDIAIMRWSGDTGTWVQDSPFAAHNYAAFDSDAQRTDVVVPFSYLGIDDPSATALKLVALASSDDHLNLWAAIPGPNPLNHPQVLNPALTDLVNTTPFTLTRWLTLDSLAAEVCPSEGRFSGASLQANISADPAGLRYSFLGDGLFFLMGDLFASEQDFETELLHHLARSHAPVVLDQELTYTVNYRNDGIGTAPEAFLAVIVYEPLRVVEGDYETYDLNGSTVLMFRLGNLEPGNTGALSFKAKVDPALDGAKYPRASVDVLFYDAIEWTNAIPVPYEWLWSDHEIDREGPSGVQIVAPSAYVQPGEVVIEGRATDMLPIPTITLEVQAPTGETQTVNCTDATPTDGMWQCAVAMDTGASGESYQVRAQASDSARQTSDWSAWQRFTLDTAPPTITMDGDANTIGNNGIVSPNTNRITGSMTDNGLVVGLELCNEDTEDSMCSQQPVSPAQATTWSYALPVGEENDGVQQQLRVFGKDSAGNVSTTPISLTYTADAVAPVITVTNQLETLSLAQIAAGTPMLAGSVSDGGGVQSVTANILPTEGDTFQQQALNVEQATWSYTPAGLAAGSYFITIEAQDLAGNSRTYGPYDLTITP